MPAPVRSLIAAVALAVAGSAAALAAGDGRSDLAHRVAGATSSSAAFQRVAYGALPPGFALPSPAPRLAILGSSWVAGTNPPEGVRVYYKPSPATATELVALDAALKQRGYRRVSASGFANLFVGDDGTTQRWCPSDYAPALFLTTVTVGAQHALDVGVMPSSAEPCTTAARAQPTAAAPLPALGNIPGIAVDAPSRAVQPGRIESTAVLRSALLASSVLARLAARIEAAGWRGEPAVVEGESLQQRFTRADRSSAWTLDLRLDERAPQTYDATIVASAS
jgi:hypothetical protein